MFEGSYEAPLFALLSFIAVILVSYWVTFRQRRVSQLANLEQRTATLSSSLAEATRELEFLALHDHLTHLPNRVLLNDRLDQTIRSASRKNSSFALLFVDLDAFKTVNDVYGNGNGDDLLAETARRLNQQIRPQDTLARVGGDQFVLLTSVGEPADAGAMADKLINAMREPFQVDHHELRVSCSIGVALFPHDGVTADELFADADAAMYHAKSLGRNTYCFFEASMNANALEQMQLIQDLRLALERNELTLHYQPKFTVAGQHVTGMEALVRWPHLTRGLIQPDQFIHLAEKTGLILPLGEWVLNQACRQLAQWHLEGHTTWTIAVNLSPQQFKHASLVETVRSALLAHDLAPGFLTLEVTESTAMHDADVSLRILQQLCDIGVHISIDDFGTGYSSLLYLKRLPANELKIDRGFIGDLAQGTEDAAIVSAVVALGQALELDIVAEGVETLEQKEFLSKVGCHSLQGYLLGRPMTAEQITQHFGGQETAAVPPLLPGALAETP